MTGYVNGQKVALVKDRNTGKWVPNAVAVVNDTTRDVAAPINPLDVSPEYQRGFMDAFNQLGAVLDGVADSGELQMALNMFRDIRANGGGPNENITFQDLMNLINDCRARRTSAGLLGGPNRQAIGSNRTRIGYNG